MTEFTREQKKEFLMQELEFTQEIDALERQIEEHHQNVEQAARYINMVLQEGKSLNGTVYDITEDQVRQSINIDEILRLCGVLRTKRGEFSDVQSILRMVRG